MSVESSPLVSVVTPAYNEEEHIRDTIESVLNQQYSNIEHIVIDDGSTDSTPTILEEYGDRDGVRIISKENEGQAATVNRGFELANGEYVIWLNGDDVLFNVDSVSRVVNFFESNPGVDIAYGDRATIDEHNNLRNIQIPFKRFSKERLQRACFGAFIFFRSSVTSEHKLDESFDYVLDYEYFLRLVDKGFSFGYIDHVLLGYRSHQDTKSVEHSDSMWEESKKVRAECGQPVGLKFYIYLFSDYVAKTTLQARTFRYIFEYRDSENLAFDAKIPPVHRLILSQLASMLPDV